MDSGGGGRFGMGSGEWGVGEVAMEVLGFFWLFYYFMVLFLKFYLFLKIILSPPGVHFSKKKPPGVHV